MSSEGLRLGKILPSVTTLLGVGGVGDGWLERDGEGGLVREDDGSG